MKVKPSVIAMIPARRGSQRLRFKNLALLNGKPLISYALKAAVEANIFDKVIINSEDAVFDKIARRYKVDFYRRPKSLATSEAKSDSVVYDFMLHNPADIVAWVNPTSPLQSAREIKEVVDYFIKGGFDSLITVKNEQVHCLYQGKALNFDPLELFAKTQDLPCVSPFVYSVMIWKTSVFKRYYELRGHAMLCGKIGYYPVGKLASIIIKHKEDLELAEYVLRGMRKKTKLSYDRMAK